MTGRWTRRAICVAAAATLAALVVAPAGANPKATARPVSTLDPVGTARIWRRLVAHPLRFRAAADCRPLRAVFYTESDWLRLASKLAQNASPCAQYYVSVPPYVADKTQLRPDQAWRIRALGANFHALAEIQWAAWGRWVASNGSSWFAAGVEARRRMAAAGFDVSKGDTWAVNEFPSSVRAGGNDRANAREFVRGLYTGDGTAPVKGVVFVIGVGQPSTGLAAYQTVVQNWLTDSGFWSDMSAYVSDWSQEVYSDMRNYGVPGAPIQTRRDYLNDYLQHVLALVDAGPPEVDAARAYLQGAYTPLANAAWQWDFGYGWTMVPFDQMQSFVSAQVYALRSFSVAAGESQDHWGFAWAPRNATGLSASDFANQTGAILDRLGAAIRDSGQTSDPSDPGGGACGTAGQNLYCDADLAGAQFTDAWKSFRTWTQPVLAFTTPPQSLQAGAPSGAITLALQTSTGSPQNALSLLNVTVSSSSPRGQFSTAPTGPWSSTLALTIPAGGNTAGPFYYQDTTAGSPVLSAAAAGITNGTQTETVLPGPATAIRIAPPAATIAAAASQAFTADGVDSFGNVFPVAAIWSVTPGLGAVKPQTGSTATFVAAARGGTGSVTATAAGASGSLSASAAVTIKPGSIVVASIRYRIAVKALLLTATVVDATGRPLPNALVSVLVRRRGYRWFTGSKRTAAGGQVTYRLRRGRGCFRAVVTGVAAPGYAWPHTTPPNGRCI